MSVTRPWGPGLTFLVEVQDGAYGTLSREDAQEAVRTQVAGGSAVLPPEKVPDC